MFGIVNICAKPKFFKLGPEMSYLGIFGLKFEKSHIKT